MALTTCHLPITSVQDLPCIGALTDQTTTRAFFCAGVSADRINAATGNKAEDIKGSRRALQARVPAGLCATPLKSDHEAFAGKSVLIALRNAETAGATGDWLRYHAAEQGAEAAVIIDRADPAKSTFARDLAHQELALPVRVVTCERPLGRADGLDMRHPNTAPAGAKRETAPVDANPWHAPFWEFGILDLVYHAFLTRARAVALVGIADLLLPAADQVSVFDAVSRVSGQYRLLQGVEIYPWRLRKGKPAPHSDHIARRRTERRALLGWCFAPVLCPEVTGLTLVRPNGLSPAEGQPLRFIRAMGVAYPGTEVERLVKKSDLREEPDLIPHLARSFDASPLRLPRAAPIPPRPRDLRLTVVTAMKNEGPFVLDWVAHNRALGVNHHLVYTNDCADGTDRLLDCLAEAGVTRRDNPYRDSGLVPQYAAFRAAEQEPVVRDAHWLMTLDVDEYINIHAGDGRLADLLDTLPEAHVISMPWRLFGNADQHGFADLPVTERFTRCAPAFAPRPLQAWAFKTLYRNEGLFRRLGVHRPKGLNSTVRGSLNWVDGCGHPVPLSVWERIWRMSKMQWGYDHVTLNHYAVRSAESFLIKRERGKVNRTRREQGLAYWFRMNHNAEEDRSIQKQSPHTAAEKARLLALPGVAEAHAQAVAWHKDRARHLLADAEYAALYQQITSHRMEHLSRIATNFGANVHLVGPQVIPDDIAATTEGVPFYWTVKLDRA